MKIIINICYGGFNLSTEAFEALIDLGMTLGPEGEADICSYDYESYSNKYYFSNHNNKSPNPPINERTDPLIIKVVEELGPLACGHHSKLKIVEIPDGVEYTIEEYDGIEWVAEAHRTWN